jgi:hypothetical protein
MHNRHREQLSLIACDDGLWAEHQSLFDGQLPADFWDALRREILANHVRESRRRKRSLRLKTAPRRNVRPPPKTESPAGIPGVSARPPATGKAPAQASPARAASTRWRVAWVHLQAPRPPAEAQVYRNLADAEAHCSWLRNNYGARILVSVDPVSPSKATRDRRNLKRQIDAAESWPFQPKRLTD